MYNNYNYGVGNEVMGSLNSAVSAGVWLIVSFVLALIGCFVVYFVFVKTDKDYPNKFVTWVKNFLNFKEMLIEPILKISYIFFAIYITLSSFAFISISFIYFLCYLIFGNIAIRLAYEMIMLLIGIWRNTTDINKKMKK